MRYLTFGEVADILVEALACESSVTPALAPPSKRSVRLCKTNKTSSEPTLKSAG